MAARYDYEYWLRREVTARPHSSRRGARGAAPPDLREQAAAAAKRRPSSRSTRARARGRSRGAPQSRGLAEAGDDLTIKMLGPVEVYRDPARPLAADAWTTKRARDILCFIASRRHRRASKDTIIDTFWGESDFDAVEKNFHPTVSHIRKALNSNQPVKQNFLLYRDGDYLLNQDFSYSIDIEEFDRLVAEGESARRAGDEEKLAAAYDSALELYRGDFLQGSYDDWVEEQRPLPRAVFEDALNAGRRAERGRPRSLKLAQAHPLRARPRDVHC